MVELTFTNPAYLWTLLLVPFIVLIHIFTLKYTRAAALKFSNFEAIERVSKGEFLGKPYHGFLRNKNVLLLLLRVIIYTLIILSVSGTTLWYTGRASDFDFVIAIDTSASMLADDFNQTRLGAAKEAAKAFIGDIVGKTSIGIVSFSGAVFVDKEPTSDKSEAKRVIDGLDIKESGGTNIGDSIITAANLLKGNNAKAIILMTDGQSNTGTPIDVAVDYVKSRAVIIYTIGIGTKEGGKLFGLQLTSKLDEDTLKKISEDTSGKYFRAESKEFLDKAFKEIASFGEKRVSLNLSWIFLITSLILLGFEWILLHTIYKTIP